ncbi:transcriptional regulator BetI [Thioclava sp. SK-1]|uniref:transcriptional regulator BetI n=1 Tax=Thioclava sp. SK-1 TaxID=1889770 RepID=UPI0008251F73|nr:transcriptional regulator BetI [Thioclava sp. SK-1]OCX59967.1 transcriptional regulator BetI [Thioclava sp. SK-1]
MPKIGAEPIRRAALVKATIETIGEAGTLEVTVAQIARRAGMSSALAHHYFGSKEQIFLAAMRAILSQYGAEVRVALAQVATDGPEARLRAITIANFAPASFKREAISAWLNFYVLAQKSAPARRLLSVYQRRLRSNLLYELRPLVGSRALAVAEGLGAIIDGVYIRAALTDGPADAKYATEIVMEYLNRELRGTA